MLSLCLIVKNEEKNLERLFPTIIDYVDEVVLVDTGSTDKTKSVAEKLCGKKLSYHTFEWIDDFSAARQFSFDKATGDYLMWVDADDTIVGAEHIVDIIADMQSEDIHAAMFKYEYQYDYENGIPIITQWRERIVKAGVFEWKNRLHEVLVPIQKGTGVAKKYEDVVYYHHKTDEDTEATKNRNVRIMKKALEDDASEPRNWYNMGNAYYGVDEYELAIEHYRTYLEMSEWPAERYVAYNRLAVCERKIGNFDNSNLILFKAMLDSPQYPDAYYHVGLNFMLQSEYAKAVQWLSVSAAKPIPTDLPVIESANYDYNLFKTIGYCYLNMGHLRDAYPYFEAIDRMIPEEKNKKILETLRQGIEEADIIDLLLAFARIEDLPIEFWETIPKEYYEHVPLVIERNKRIPVRTETNGKQIAIYCGASGVAFDNNSLERGGIGGSEEAIIEVSRGLADAGYNVTVFNRPEEEIGYKSKGTVTYAHYTDFNPRDKWDVLVSWRMPGVFQNSKLNADKTYLWLHDTNDPRQMTEGVIDHIDGIWVVSDWHASLYPHVPDEKIFVIENGINPKDFEGVSTEKQKGYCINTSSPDRGLHCLLTLWPKIREQVPHAELHWFYGWDGYDALHGDNPEKMAWKEEVVKLFDQPGVYDHGKVPPSSLVPEYAKAELWLYPTEFTETYCITAIKCQYMGAYPVTTNIAALDENVQYGVKLPYDDIYTNEKAQEAFIDSAVKALTDRAQAEFEMEGSTNWVLDNKTWGQTVKRVLDIIN